MVRYGGSLHTLVSHLADYEGEVGDERDIEGIRLDSRQVEPGDLFVACPGTELDGHDFIPEAVAAGAAAVVGSQPAEEYDHLSITYLSVPDPRQAAAKLSAAFYGFPARELTVIGVTGTDGKTTTANLIYHMLQEAGYPTGMISTVNAVIGGERVDTGFHVTTPEAPDVQRYLRRMVDSGLSHVVIEATSHGLAQKRVDECAFSLAVFTNITHEHLDYHGSTREYREAKARLLDLVAKTRSEDHQPGRVILNADDESYPFLEERAQQLGLKILSYGLEGGDIGGKVLAQDASHIKFEVRINDQQKVLETPLIGLYNVSNNLAAIAACREGMGIPWDAVQRGIRSLSHIPGRMERIDRGQPFTVIVDFAHTPNALEQALTTGRNIVSGRVIAVFGSAGLRDREKRRMMAEISARLADLTVLTAEDPRTESLADILEEMAAGVRSQGGVEGETFWRVPDRGEAIRFALDQAQAEDLVIVCGKGHEQSMCFGEREYPWDDRVAARAALADYLGQEGPDMPYLPTQEG